MDVGGYNNPRLLKLFCLLDDGSRFFQVKADIDYSFFDVMDLICEARPNALRNVDPSQLLLFHVSLLPLA
jgi:hypothetical protein